jgi:hypothetical protein
MSAPKTRKKNIRAVEFRRQCLDLRKRGYTYQKIAEALNSRSGTVEKGIKKALAEMIAEPAAEVLLLELARLDLLLIPQMSAAIRGNQGACDRAIKIMERRAKYLGLDKKEEADANKLSPDDIVKMFDAFKSFLPIPGDDGQELEEADGLEPEEA